MTGETITLPVETRTPSPLRAEIQRARSASLSWRRLDVADRTRRLASFRGLLVERSRRFVDVLRTTQPRPAAEIVSSELLPVAEACRFLERSASRILRPRRLGRRGRPVWLGGVSGRVTREPHGVVLVVAPSNYPLQLAGIQVLQAITAGNGVVWKPGRGSTTVAQLVVETLAEAGVPTALVAVLSEDERSVPEALAAGVDKLVMTGSFASGEGVLAAAAEHAVPATMELSGCDAAFVLPSADVDLAARTLAYAILVNGGRTCLAPRRIFVKRQQASRLLRRLVERLERSAAIPLDDRERGRLESLLLEAERRGASLACGSVSAEGVRPVVMVHDGVRSELLTTDVFAPVTSLVPVDGLQEALDLDATCPYGLGASIFGHPSEAEALARELDVGCVFVNDLIVPLADPRVPLGGRRRSGFGVTRGPEGLLEMTRPKVHLRRGGTSRPHLGAGADDERLLTGLLRAAHARRFVDRCRGWVQVVRRALFPARPPREESS